MVQENAHKFAQTILMPRVIEDNRKEVFDKSIMKAFGDNGFLGCTLK